MIKAELKQEFVSRWQRLQNAICSAGADAMLITTNVNLYYVAGRIYSGIAYIPAQGEPMFFVRRPVGIEGVIYIRKIEDITEHLPLLPDKLMIELDSVSYCEYQRYAKLFASAEIVNATPAIRSVRAIKTPYEIEQIRLSGVHHANAYANIPNLYRKGMTDLEFSIEIERECRLNGSLGIFRVFGQSMEIFMGSVIAGNNADAPSPYDFAMGGAGIDASLPVGSSGMKLTEGMSVMVDVGGNFTGYMTDMTRVFSIGKLTDLAYKAHQVSVDIQNRIILEFGAGSAAKDIYDLAVSMAEEAGLADYFMGYTQKAGFIGHGVGIEINEAPVFAPRSRDILAEGMVFALEPKFVIPNVGAVGTENTYAVIGGHLEKLTICPEQIIELK